MVKDEILKNIQAVLKKINVKGVTPTLEKPTNSDFGDYATSVALKLAGGIKNGNFLKNINWLVKNVKKNNFESFKNLVPISKLQPNVIVAIKSKLELVYLKPRVYAKIRGWFKHIKGHKEIKLNHFFLLPYFIYYPSRILRDKRNNNIYHFVIDLPRSLDIVIDLFYEKKEDLPQISSLYFTRNDYLKNFEEVKIKKDSGGRAAVPPYWPPAKGGVAGSRFSSLRQNQLLYNKLSKQSQVDILSYEEKKSPLQIAEEIVKNLPKNVNIKKVEIIKPGFINFWIADVQLINQLTKTLRDGFDFPKYYLGKKKKVMVEFAHPNTHKLFHIGHLRNISTGETLVRILEAVGNKVIRGNYQGDVGLHIAKCLYGIQNSKFRIQNLKTLQEKIEFIGKMYSSGTKAYEDDEKTKQEIIKINRMIYDHNPEIMPLWTETRQWSLDYFDENYKRFYSYFDRLYFESELPKRGIEIVQELLKKGILEKSQGAIVFNGKKYGLDTRVFVNSLGFPTYEGKELALAEKEFSDFGELDKIIHTVTPEQTSFFKVIFKVEELIDEKKYKNKQYHLIYEWVKLRAGKMSSREGNIVEANWLIDEVKKKILEKFKCDKDTSEILAVASAKYSFLKNSTQTIIAFDIDESISIEGNSAPYLIYTYVRCQSVLKKSLMTTVARSYNSRNINNDEKNLLRTLYQFQEIVQEAAIQFAPNLIANYLYELAQKYNYFYQKNKILGSEEKTKQFRLMLTRSTGKVIKEGLYLLGIKTVEKM